MLEGRDVLGQAQTGTGKTAAFALPVLSNIDLQQIKPQALILAPTRELAIQVAEAFQSYSSKIPGFRVLPVYGGQPYGQQLSALRRGVHIVVGTPGRVIDHLDRSTLDLSELKTLVLDEADEMLRMGFIDDVEAVLKKLPEQRQVALFSATMPPQIRRIAQTYLQDPVEVTIAAKTTTSANIRQRYWWVSGMHKLDALTRILEVEPFDAMIIFARTKAGTEELASKLQARGLAAAAINGDMQQAQRERTIAMLKEGKLDILVATDVAARGLDVERISHVLNYDIPYDTEATCTASAVPAVPAAAARRSCSPPRARRACCARSSAPPASRSKRCSCRAWKRSTTTASTSSPRASPKPSVPAAWTSTASCWSASRTSRTCRPSRSPPRWPRCCRVTPRSCCSRRCVPRVKSAPRASVSTVATVRSVAIASTATSVVRASSVARVATTPKVVRAASAP